MQTNVQRSAMSPELRALASVLQRILIGDRNPSLDGLPGELASAVRGLVGRLR
ncbi:MAG: hypothetical protein IPL78_07620 [Chloroflexi bacterium]|nr:hypothetical protein [Chloroflexota bacterium]